MFVQITSVVLLCLTWRCECLNYRQVTEEWTQEPGPATEPPMPGDQCNDIVMQQAQLLNQMKARIDALEGKLYTIYLLNHSWSYHNFLFLHHKNIVLISLRSCNDVIQRMEPQLSLNFLICINSLVF